MDTTTTTDTASTEAPTIPELIASLEAQLAAVNAAISAQTVDWRAAAADPKAVTPVAERLAVLRQQRALLLRSVAEAELAQQQVENEANAERVRALVEEASAPLFAALDRRVQLGLELAEVTQRMGDLVKELDSQGKEIIGMFAYGTPASRVSGVADTTVNHRINAEDARYLVDQTLAWRLGHRLWPSETSHASHGISVAARIEGECLPVRNIFKAGVARLIDTLQPPKCPE